jgi:hypothetical protein
MLAEFSFPQELFLPVLPEKVLEVSRGLSGIRL